MSSEKSDPRDEKPPILRSAFLNECFDYLAEAEGLPEAMVFPSFKDEKILFSYFPELKHGIASYHFEDAHWDWYGNENEGEVENFIVEILASGSLGLRPGDDSFFYLEFLIEQGEEIGECFEFFQLKLHTQSPDIPGLQKARNWS